MLTNPQTIENLGFDIQHRKNPRSVNTVERVFKSLYGTYPEIICYIWNQLILKRLLIKYDKNKLQRFFLMFDFLKNYCVEHRSAVDFGIDEKTYRKWVWFYLEKVSQLAKNVVS